MTCAATRRPSRCKLIPASLILSFIAAAHAAPPTANQANVELHTDLNTMAVHIGQSAPLPPGGCNPGYAWHTTYGGCRIAQKQSESAQCPAGQTGTRERDRTAYTLQANPSDVAYDDWGTWKEDCRPLALAPAKVCRFDVKKTYAVFDYTDTWRLWPAIFLVWDGITVGYGEAQFAGAPSWQLQWRHDFLKNGIVLDDYRYTMGAAVAVDSADTGVFRPGDIYAYYELCREPVAPVEPPEETAYKMGDTAYVRSVPINPAGVGGPPPPTLSWKGKNIPLTMPEGSPYLTDWEGYRYYAVELKERRPTASNGLGLFYSVRRVKL